MDTKNKDSTNSILLLVGLVGVLICGIWIGAWYVSSNPFESITTITEQPVADIFSSVNALFAGLAFGGVIITVYLQINEIRDSRIELTRTADANKKMSETSELIAKREDEKFILNLFQTYCSDYFQGVKDDSQKVLFSCIGNKGYCDFVVSRLFAAYPLENPFLDNVPDNIMNIMKVENREDFLKKEQNYRYKLDELINFFTILTGEESTRNIIGRCDFNYSFWRPYFWIIAKKQDNRYNTEKDIKKYSTKPYFLNVVKKLDIIYGFTPFQNENEMFKHIVSHPKISPFIDEEFTKSKAI